MSKINIYESILQIKMECIYVFHCELKEQNLLAKLGKNQNWENDKSEK
jgi:hypothetical protein